MTKYLCGFTVWREDAGFKSSLPNKNLGDIVLTVYTNCSYISKNIGELK
tara:strand:- start:1874 stop:2020 length:147 start_codon:yes stop_codon:yes gene_type:complete